MRFEKEKELKSKSQLQNFSPLTLEGRDAEQVRFRDRDGIIEGGMRSQEIVMSDKKDGSRDSAVEVIEAMSRSDMGFISSVKSFDELFKRSEFRGDGIKILKTCDRFMRDRIKRSGKIEEIDGFGISRVAVGDSGDFLVWGSGAKGFTDRCSSREDTFGVVNVIRDDSSGFRRDKEEGIEFFSKDFDISFVACDEVVNFSFEREIKLVAKESSDLGIIKDGLIRDRNLKNFSEYKSGFSCRYTEGDMEGKSKSKSVKRVSDMSEIKRDFIWLRNAELVV